MSNLNPAQKKAAHHDAEHLLIVAGPGTGKTHTLTRRIQFLLPKLIPGQKVLAVTFTHKAAREMRERLTALNVDLDQQVFVGTFHAFALNLLRSFQEHLPFPLTFSIATPDEIDLLAGELWPERSRAERRRTLQKISAWKSSLAEHTDDADITVFRAFLRQKERVDFDDILRDAVVLLRDNADVRRAVQRQYPFILVDEYQDINAMQETLLTLLVGAGVRIMAIGDPNQAIYGFRGSDVGFFHAFPQKFVPCDVIELNKNYRSAPNLLEASAQVVDKGARFAVPALTAAIYAKGLLKIHETPTEKAEAEYIAHTIEKMVGGVSSFSRDSGRVGAQEGGRSFADIAILYRLNAQGRVLAKALERLGVPYQISGDTLPSDPATARRLQDLPQGADVAELLRTPEDVFVPRAEKVLLSTLHAAKGLEFPVVFIAGCEEGLLPLALDFFDTDPEEERRLFYVGMTRAKEELILVRSKKRVIFGKSLSGQPSPFLADIEESLKAYEEARLRKPRRDPDRDQIKFF